MQERLKRLSKDITTPRLQLEEENVGPGLSELEPRKHKLRAFAKILMLRETLVFLISEPGI